MSLEKFIQRNSQNQHIFDELSYTVNISIEEMEKFINKSWVWGNNGLSSNEFITPEFIERFIDRDWDYEDTGLSSNLNLTADFINRYSYKPWNWGRLFSVLPMSVICGIEHEWIYGIDTELFNDYSLQGGWYILPFKTTFINFRENYCGLSANPNITMEFVEVNLDKPWNFGAYGLSMNPAITTDFIKKYIDKPWNFGKGGLSANPAINIDFVKNNRDADWSSAKLYANPSISSNDIEKYFEKWSRDTIAWQSDITVEFIDKHIDRVCWQELSENTSITPELVEKYIDKPWHWGEYGLSSNPILTRKFVDKHSDKLLEFNSLVFKELNKSKENNVVENLINYLVS